MQTKRPTNRAYCTTLDFLISISLRLLILGMISRVYGLIGKPALIDLGLMVSSEIFLGKIVKGKM